MAGGYICKKFEWDGGRTDTAAERTAYVLKGCAQALLDTNTGWALDTAKNATLDDYIQASGDKLYQNSAYAGSPCYILFFTSTSGAKLMLGYRYGFVNRADVTGYSSALDVTKCLGGFPGMGLFASVIPPGSASVFSTTAPFIDGDATPIALTSRGTTSTSSTYYTKLNYSFAYSNDINVTFRYFLITNGANIIVLNNSNLDVRNQKLYNGFICGNIFSTNFNSEDTKKAGAFLLGWNAGRIVDSASAEMYEKFIASQNLPSTYLMNLDTSWFTAGYINAYAGYLPQAYRAYQNADGAWVTGVFSTNDSSTFHGITMAAATSQLSATVGTKRWVPVYVYGAATDATVSDHEIVTGGGNTLKGYIDPDLARLVNNNSRYARGTTFDNGNLIYLGGGLAVGWDPSNTVAIF